MNSAFKNASCCGFIVNKKLIRKCLSGKLCNVKPSEGYCNSSRLDSINSYNCVQAIFLNKAPYLITFLCNDETLFVQIFHSQSKVIALDDSYGK